MLMPLFTLFLTFWLPITSERLCHSREKDFFFPKERICWLNPTTTIEETSGSPLINSWVGKEARKEGNQVPPSAAWYREFGKIFWKMSPYMQVIGAIYGKYALNKVLIASAKSGNVFLVSCLLKTPFVDINTSDGKKITPLMWASARGHLGVVARLLAHASIDLNKATQGGVTALHIATSKGHSAIVLLLLGHGDVAVNRVDNKGCSALQWASHHHQVPMVALLLKHPKINANTQNIRGDTPLIWASYKGNEAIARLLLSHPFIDPNRAIKEGDTPLYAASYKGHAAIVSLLLAHPKIDINKKKAGGFTALYIATKSGHADILYLLLAEKKINPLIEDYKGQTTIAYLLENLQKKRLKSIDQKRLYALLYRRYDALFHGYLRVHHGIPQRSHAALLTYIPYRIGFGLAQFLAKE